MPRSQCLVCEKPLGSSSRYCPPCEVAIRNIVAAHRRDERPEHDPLPELRRKRVEAHARRVGRGRC